MRTIILFILIFKSLHLFAQKEATPALKNSSNLFTAISVEPRMRIIIDNDFAGDPDGLFQLVHHVLSPSTEIRGIIGSHLPEGQAWGVDGSADSTATYAKRKIEEVLHIMKLDKSFPVYAGSNKALGNDSTPQITEAAKTIIEEAMRTDTKLPLFVVCGAGLTDLASAYLMKPEIASRLTLIWIGGPEYEGIGLPLPVKDLREYNTGIDVKAAQVIFNKSSIPIWQVPRNCYRQALISYASLLVKVKNQGALGTYLVGSVEEVTRMLHKFNINPGETYVLGDSPLVVLTALQSTFETDASSSEYIIKTSPLINNNGFYEANLKGRNIRVYTKVDTYLLFEDFFSKLTLFNQKQR